MWSKIKPYFEDYPAQMKVAKLLFERGFQVNSEGKIVSGNIEIPHVQIAKEAGVERRTVDSTAKTILSNPTLKRIFTNIKQVNLLYEAARELGLTTIIFTPKDATQPGIIAQVTKTISEANLSIRQAYAEDPGINPEPKLIITIDGEIPIEIIKKLREIPGAKSVTIL